VVLFGMKR